jgi:hypothetical protein
MVGVGCPAIGQLELKSAAPWKTGSAPVYPGITGNSLTWTRVRSLVTDRARSRVRREDVGNGSAAEGDGAHRLDGERRHEDALARAEDSSGVSRLAKSSLRRRPASLRSTQTWTQSVSCASTVTCFSGKVT